MARTRVFVSSTYYDLKHVRASLEVFIESMGFDAVLNERGNIPYDHLTPLDQSCYREVANCDILILIIGGVTGSEVSAEKLLKEEGQSDKPKETPLQLHYKEYNSITKREFESAIQKNIQTFVLVDAGVHAEYQTFKKNRENKTVQYAHASNVSIFHLLDHIYNLQKNNAVHAFDRIQNAQMWLREQLSGLFRELLRERTQASEFVALRDRIEELKRINESIEKLVKAGLEPESDHAELIDRQQSEDERYRDALYQISNDKYCQNLLRKIRLSQRELTSIFLKATTLDDFFSELGTRAPLESVDAARSYFANEEGIDGINKIRKVLNLPLFENQHNTTVIKLSDNKEVVFSGISAYVADIIVEFCELAGRSIMNLVLDEELKQYLVDSPLLSRFMTQRKLFDAAANVIKKINRVAAS